MGCPCVCGTGGNAACGKILCVTQVVVSLVSKGGAFTKVSITFLGVGLATFERKNRRSTKLNLALV